MFFEGEEDTAIDYNLFRSLTNSINYGRSAEQGDSEDSVFAGSTNGRGVGRQPRFFNLGATQETPFRYLSSNSSDTRQDSFRSLAGIGRRGSSTEVGESIQHVSATTMPESISAIDFGTTPGDFSC